MHSYHILFRFVMGAVKTKMLQKSYGEKGTAESWHQIHIWAKIQ